MFQNGIFAGGSVVFITVLYYTLSVEISGILTLLSEELIQGGDIMDAGLYKILFDKSSTAISYNEIINDNNLKPAGFNVIEYNKLFSDITGYKKDDLSSQSVKSYFDSTEYLYIFGKALSQETDIELTEYFDSVKKWHHVKVVPFDKKHFAVILTEIPDFSFYKKLERYDYSEIEKSLIAIYDNSSVLTCIVDSERNIKYANRAMKIFSGLSDNEIISSKACGVFGCLNSFLTPEGCGYSVNCGSCSIYSTINKTFKTGEFQRGVEFESDFRRGGDVEHFYFLVSATRINSVSGYLVILTLLDVTEKKKMERDIISTRVKLELILDNADEGILGIDNSGNQTFVNKKAASILKYDDKDELIGGSSHLIWHYKKTDGSVYNEEDCPIFKALNEDSPQFGEDYFIAKDGSFIPVQFSAVPFTEYDGGKSCVIVFRDISEQKMKDALIETGRERLKLATEGAGIGIWDYYIDSNTLLWDDVMFELFEVSKNKFTNNADFFFNTLDYDTKKRVYKAFRNSIETGENFDVEFHYITKSMKVKYIKGIGKILRDPSGKPHRFVGINYDITGRRNMESELIKAKETADAASIAKSQFLANMSHEIRTPLNGIIGFSELLEYTELDSVQKEYLDNILISGNALLDVINDILDFSKIEAGKLELHYEKTDLIKLIENTADMVKFLAHNKGIELLLNISPSIPRFIFTDSVRLKQVISNLLGNAVKFTGKGEVELTVSAEINNGEGGRVSLSFSVRDTGIGVSQEQVKKLFKAFSQADSSTTRKYGGTGLGLIISKRILEKMGSNLCVDSVLNEGSRFYFTVETAYEKSSSNLCCGNIDIANVLIVDDNRQSLDILKRMLEFKNIHSDCFTNPLEVFSGCSIADYDLLIADFNVPEMNGFDFIEKLRMIDSEIPVIMLFSALNDNLISEKSAMYNINKRLTKPVKISELFAALSDIKSRNTVCIKDVKTKKSAVINGRFKILIAEDNKVNIALLKILIKKIIPDAVIAEAGNGNTALSCFKEKKPDLVFLDIQMPEMDGYEAVKCIRELDENVPVIALTAEALFGEREKCLSYGMSDYIAKPVSIEKLNRVISAYLS